MKTIEDYAKIFTQKNLGKGRITKLTDYSFTWVTFPKKKTEKSTTCVYMLSYFL